MIQSEEPEHATTSSHATIAKKVLVPSLLETNINTVAGLVCGLFQAGLFNPWDRALYLSVRDRRHFLHPTNFANPFQGFWQAIVHRTISGGLYFTLQSQYQTFFALNFPDLAPRTQLLYVGLLAGLTNGMILNQLATIKYHSWNKGEGKQVSFSSSCLEMAREGGLRPFFKGIYLTGARDTVFGIVYEISRIWLFQSGLPYFVSNIIGGAMGTIASTPLNFARNIKFITPPHLQAPTFSKIFLDLYHETILHRGTLERMKHLQQRMNLGWGTTKVGVSMAFGQFFFEWAKEKLLRCNSIYVNGRS